ncbi:MAG: hypothetical protein U1F43_16475 [Myxococcota bacterium]
MMKRVLTNLMLGVMTAAATMVAVEARAEPATTVFLNGTPTPVFFNDGDSFRVVGGPMDGMKTRLAGYNTLESYGKAHQWGAWTAQELFILAKMGTYNARRGVWHCTSDMKTDTYGRTLWVCPDLVVDQLEKGLAHVLSVSSSPGDPKYVEAMHKAQEAKRGIWAKGIPDFILTSLHSIDESATEDGTYNRLVSTKDGHSLKWIHDEKYSECQTVCDDGAEEGPRLDAALRALKGDPTLAGIIKGESGTRPYDDEALMIIASDYARKKPLDRHMKKADHLALFMKVLDGLGQKGELGGRTPNIPACMIYVDFQRRFGGGRAACLK